MRSPIATLQELTIPMGAGADRPAIYVGPRVPPAVAAFYAPAQVIACVVFRQDSADYLCFALVDPAVGLSFVGVGGIESVGLTYSEALRWRLHGGLGNNPTSTDIFGAFTFDGRSAARGLRAIATLQTPYTPAGLVEEIFLSTAQVDWVAGRAYEIRLAVDPRSSASGANVAQFLLRLDVGTLLASWFMDLPTGGHRNSFERTVIVRALTDRAATAIDASIQSLGTSVVIVDQADVRPGTIRIWDIGAAADYPDAHTVS